VQTTHSPYKARKHTKKTSEIPIHNLLYIPMLTKTCIPGEENKEDTKTTHHTPGGQYITTSTYGKEN
jgi:hypothetical protein